MGVTGTQNEK